MAESEASPDQQLELKKRARRRLVGAVALALLAAIVLPMVMDHEPRPVSQDIQVRIPSQDAAVAGRVPLARPAPPVAEAPEPKPEPKHEPKHEPKAEAKAEPRPEAKPEPKVEAPAPKPSPVPPAKPAEPAAEKKAEEARAAAALSGQSEQWVVQLGAYKDAGNVKLLLAKLKGVGLPAYTEAFDSPQGPRTRVRAGPFPSKEAAEKAKAKVKIIGVDGPVAPK